MWIQGGFSPDSFWHQTPLHFQLAMRGVRKRLENESEARLHLAYETGAFSGLANHGQLKALANYKPKKPQTVKDAIEVLKGLGARSDMVIREVPKPN